MAPQLSYLAVIVTPLDTLSDRQLARRFLSGSSDAFTTLFTRHRAYVLSVCLLHSLNRSDAEEAASDTFLRVYRHLRGFRWTCAFTTWLYRVAKGQALNRRRPSCHNAIGKEHVSYEDVALVDATPGPREMAIANETNALLEREIARLNPRHRNAVEASRNGVMTPPLDVCANTGRTRLLRARETLRRRLLRHPEFTHASGLL